LKTALLQQLEQAPAFLDVGWPEVRDQANENVHGWQDTFEDIFICGCGDSHHAAVNLELALTLWTGKRVRALRSSQAVYELPPHLMRGASRTLVIGISASGEVARTREALSNARAFGARTIALTGKPRSYLAEIAEGTVALAIPEVPFGPGLLNYLASLMMGYSLAWSWSDKSRAELLDRSMRELPVLLASWVQAEFNKGKRFAEQGPDQTCIFLGGGPLYGSAMFAAAKQIEAAGTQAWGQDVEEWAHIEYFCQPADMPTWLLHVEGIRSTRAREVIAAAEAIGRRLQTSTWLADPIWPGMVREALAPLVMWVGPVVCASRRQQLLRELPFRDFGGGRSREEGGGASRIRSSEMLDEKKLERYFSWDFMSN
jgi:glucosamine--fructose-6-phosphate aminotransferase (isomerizing)